MVPLLIPLSGNGRGHKPCFPCGRFCRGIVDAVVPYVVGVKPQLAFFESLGADGLRAFEAVCTYARAAGLLVVADGKRGDIGSTARAYAEAYVEPREGEPPVADALTVNPYLGRDSLEPFLAACRRSGAGLFCLVKTSNAGSADIQEQLLADGRAPHEIAERLRISESVVDRRLALLYARMGVAGPSDAIATAHRRGLIVIADAPVMA